MAGKGDRVYREEKEAGGMQQTKSLAFHWLSPCQERSSCWAALSLQGVRAPPSGLPTLKLRFVFIIGFFCAVLGLVAQSISLVDFWIVFFND